MKKLTLVLSVILCLTSVVVCNSCVKSDAEDSKIKSTVAETINSVSDYTVKKETPAPMGLEEAKALVENAKAVYSKGDVVDVGDGKSVSPVKVPELSVEKVNEMEDAKAEEFSDFNKYIGGTISIIRAMLKENLPESYVLELYGKTNFPYPDYYFVDLASTDFEDANALFREMSLKNDLYPCGITDCVYVLRARVYYYDCETDTKTLLFPSEEENEIRNAIIDKQIEADKSPKYIVKENDSEVK